MSSITPFANRQHRTFAVIIDWAIMSGIVIAIERTGRSDKASAFGAAIAVLYFLAKDALFRGKSIGKLLVGLHVIKRNGGGPISLWTSIKRNLPPVIVIAISFGGSYMLSLVLNPEFVGKVAAGATIAGLLYVYHGADGEDHSILGDRWAGTLVVKRWNWANQSPEPTPGSVTPRADVPKSE